MNFIVLLLLKSHFVNYFYFTANLLFFNTSKNPVPSINFQRFTIPKNLLQFFLCTFRPMFCLNHTIKFPIFIQMLKTFFINLKNSLLSSPNRRIGQNHISLFRYFIKYKRFYHSKVTIFKIVIFRIITFYNSIFKKIFPRKLQSPLIHI